MLYHDFELEFTQILLSRVFLILRISEKMSCTWEKKSTAIYSAGRKLGDGGMYIIDLDDMASTGVLVQAYKQETSERYTLSVSEKEVGASDLLYRTALDSRIFKYQQSMLWTKVRRPVNILCTLPTTIDLARASSRKYSIWKNFSEVGMIYYRINEIK